MIIHDEAPTHFKDTTKPEWLTLDSLQQNYGSDSPNMTAKVNDDMAAVTLCVRTATGELARTTYVINVDANLNLEVPTLPANRLIDDG